jgi:hypothetical protein
VTLVGNSRRWLLTAVLATVPVLTLAAGPYLFQETFEDGSLDGAAIVAGEWAVESGALHSIGTPGRTDYVATSGTVSGSPPAS